MSGSQRVNHKRIYLFKKLLDKLLVTASSHSVDINNIQKISGVKVASSLHHTHINFTVMQVENVRNMQKKHTNTKCTRTYK